MKFRILAIVAAVIVLGGLYLAANLLKQESGSSSGGRPDANDIRNLKIN